MPASSACRFIEKISNSAPERLTQNLPRFGFKTYHDTLQSSDLLLWKVLLWIKPAAIGCRLAAGKYRGAPSCWKFPYESKIVGSKSTKHLGRNCHTRIQQNRPPHYGGHKIRRSWSSISRQNYPMGALCNGWCLVWWGGPKNPWTWSRVQVDLQAGSASSAVLDLVPFAIGTGDLGFRSLPHFNREMVSPDFDLLMARVSKFGAMAFEVAMDKLINFSFLLLD